MLRDARHYSRQAAHARFDAAVIVTVYLVALLSFAIPASAPTRPVFTATAAEARAILNESPYLNGPVRYAEELRISAVARPKCRPPLELENDPRCETPPTPVANPATSRGEGAESLPGVGPSSIDNLR